MINNQLTEKRARLRKAAQDYQSSLSWYQENLDSPNAEQDCDESSAAFKREIGYREMDIIADLLDEIDELQEPRKPLQDKDLQGVIDALEHPAGINAAGKQVVRHALVEIQERRKADREPVAEVVSIYGDPEAFGEREIRPLVGIQQMPYGTKLYRHAQQPVVPEDVLAALLKVARIRLNLNDFDGDCRGIADCLSDAEEALIEVVNRRAAMLAAAPQEVPDGK